ncbi:hypothetical protein ACXN5S_05265 [Pseudoroseicyclus sp. H15]
MALLHRLMLTLAALAFALSSLVAADQMAPEEPLPEGLAAYLAAGGDISDICGDLPGGHASHCPICHGLPEAPACDFAPAALRLSLEPAWPGALADLGLSPQRGNPNSSARAPPALHLI